MVPNQPFLVVVWLPLSEATASASVRLGAVGPVMEKRDPMLGDQWSIG